MSALVKYDAARYALQQAVCIDEVKDIRDKAEAMAAYARQAKDTEMIQWVTEIKVRAERRAGQMLAEMPKAMGKSGRFTGGNTMLPPVKDEKTLAELGITKNESSRWQKLAAVDEVRFEKAVTAAKEVAGEVTTAAMLRVEREDKAGTEVVTVTEARPGKKKDHKQHVDDVKPEGAPDDYPDFTTTKGREKALNESLASQAEEIQTLRDRLTAYGELSDDAITAEQLIFDLRKELSTAYATIEAITQSRDRYMNDNAQLKRQVAMMQKQIKKAA